MCNKSSDKSGLTIRAETFDDIEDGGVLRPTSLGASVTIYYSTILSPKRDMTAQEPRFARRLLGRRYMERLPGPDSDQKAPRCHYDIQAEEPDRRHLTNAT